MNDQLVQELNALRQTLSQVAVSGEANIQHMFAAQQFLRQMIDRYGKPPEQPHE